MRIISKFKAFWLERSLGALHTFFKIISIFKQNKKNSEKDVWEVIYYSEKRTLDKIEWSTSII